MDVPISTVCPKRLRGYAKVTLNTVGESSNNVVIIVKQLINSIKKRFHTKKVITSPL